MKCAEMSVDYSEGSEQILKNATGTEELRG